MSGKEGKNQKMAASLNGIDEATLQKMKIKLLISYDQWKALKAHMYWTFMIFSFVIGLLLLYTSFNLSSSPIPSSSSLPPITFQIYSWYFSINWVQLFNSLLVLSLLLKLYKPFLQQFYLLNQFINIISTIYFLIYLICQLFILPHYHPSIELLQESLFNIFQSQYTKLEIIEFCQKFTFNSPIGVLISWAILVFSYYMENNYKKVENTLKEFEELENLLNKMKNKSMNSTKPQSNQKNSQEKNKKKKKKTS